MEMKTCPRCRASGELRTVVMHDGYGVCAHCHTAWKLGKQGEMIAIPEEN